VQGHVVRKAIGSKNVYHCIGPCALVSMTLCIGYAMNRNKIYRQEFDLILLMAYFCIGLFAMPCGVTQEYSKIHGSNKV
jgi:hypothetical protein